MSAVNYHKQYPKVFFIYGPGAQETHSSTIHSWLRFVLREKIALGLASTGIAALLLPGGRSINNYVIHHLPMKGTLYASEKLSNRKSSSSIS